MTVTGKPMKDDMVERGAEAMRAKRCEMIALPLDRIWPDLMRAAIEAMREPTDAMLEAGPVEPYMDREVWRAMIDAALTAQRGEG